MEHLGNVQKSNVGIKDDFGMAYLLAGDTERHVVFLERDYINDMYRVAVYDVERYHPLKREVFGSLRESLDFIIHETGKGQ